MYFLYIEQPIALLTFVEYLLQARDDSRCGDRGEQDTALSSRSLDGRGSRLLNRKVVFVPKEGRCCNRDLNRLL